MNKFLKKIFPWFKIELLADKEQSYRSRERRTLVNKSESMKNTASFRIAIATGVHKLNKQKMSTNNGAS